MSDKVRIHLQQAILVGDKTEARYSKVLIGERERANDWLHHETVYQTFVISGYVRGYWEHALAEPTRVWLADSNILAIEDVKVEPRVSRDIQTKACSQEVPHRPHTYREAGPVTNCPGRYTSY